MVQNQGRSIGVGVISVGGNAESSRFGLAADANDPCSSAFICGSIKIMPELPEVETMRRGILGVVGSRITDVERVVCRRRPIAIAPRIDRFRRRVAGRMIRDVGRAGKRVVVRLDSDDAIVLEPRMTGLVLVADPPSREHLRFRCQLSGNGIRELLYWDRRGLGNVRLFSPAEFEAAFGPANLGPDALTLTAELYRRRLGGSRRAVKVALLDQRAVAGIGNLYASEILHAARIHPARRCDRLTRAQWQALADATHAVLEEAIRHEGSTLGDGTYRNALNEAGSYQNQHRVYDRAGEPCLNCGAGRQIKRIVQAQRSTFFCPACQPMR
jgi:formamidopyrimidine-DNA glycosylase